MPLLIIFACLSVFVIMIFRLNSKGVSKSDPRGKKQQSLGEKLVKLAMLNFVGLMAIQTVSGGEPTTEYIEYGKYYLHQKGQLTETNRWFWNFNAIYMPITFLFIPIAIIVLGLERWHETPSKEND